LPPECAPSPRTVARAQAGVKPTADRYRKQAVGRGKKRSGASTTNSFCANDPSVGLSSSEISGSSSEPGAGHVHMVRRRSHPIVHPPCEIPFCETCRQMDADMAAAAVSASTNATDGTNQQHSPSPQTPASDDDESRSWIFKQLPGPWWWCEDCQALVSSPEITIAHLFAVLRQWTPYAQLQLITIVDEVSVFISCSPLEHGYLKTANMFKTVLTNSP
uniref:PWWP domain-containing protein n=1 Tax=Echinostoma caproni TaxID=27848 RepID=A0A183A1F4_9TREM